MGNIALNKPATASSYVLPFAPSKAVDGTLTPLGRWVCNTIPGWLMVDLGKSTWINRWVVKHMSMAGFPSPSYNDQSYKLQGSNDNHTWSDIDIVTNNSQNSTDRTFIPVYYRYVRVYVDYGLTVNKNLASIEELEIYEAPNPYLKSLSLSSGSLNPAFSSTVFNYTANVGYETGSITVTPTVDDATSTVKVNGVANPSGQASAPITLNVGVNTVNVEVTASSGLKQVYTIAVTRASSPYLAGITFSNGALVGSFEKTTLNYNANIGYDGATITVTPTAEDSRAGITVNGVEVVSGQPSGSISLNVGVNPVITIVVTSKDGSDSRTYTITPTRASNPYLSAMLIVGIRGGGLTPAFNRATYAYTSPVPNSKISVQIQSTAEGGGSITVNEASVQSGQPSQAIDLQVGTNLVTVICNAATGSDSKKYEITITRAAQ